MFAYICENEGENKGADQLRSDHVVADQRLCFRYIDSTIPLLPKSEIPSFYPSSVVVQLGLCLTWSDTPDMFLRDAVPVLLQYSSPGAGCLKLTTSFVNVSLNFQTLILQIHCYFFLKKCENPLHILNELTSERRR